MATFKNAGPAMAALVSKPVPALGAEPKVVEYANPAEDGAEAPQKDGDYHGKIIVSYDPTKPAYQGRILDHLGSQKQKKNKEKK